ncbi:MAG: ribosome biogenesis GTPase Der [Legionella sp.]|nr:MAG: ribosome biogenesis GTPase Der [Legionella sp.]
MIPVIALVGRPNVGKSTLFNRITRTQSALVADFPGLTRDRLYGDAVFEDKSFIVVDTGGVGVEDLAIDDLMSKQSALALNEADVIFFLVDARAGLTPIDRDIAMKLRKLSKPVFLVVNKIDGLDEDVACADFQAMSLGPLFGVSATHGRGMTTLLQAATDEFPPVQSTLTHPDAVSIAFVGRPNVGKSTLVNRILGEERVVVYDMPGTTRDSISIPFERDERHYTLIDTAGIRRRSRVDEKIEKFSIIKTLQSIRSSHVCLMLVDAQEGLTEQDMHLLGLIIESGKALVIVVNKWDGLDEEHKEGVRQTLARRLHFANFAKIRFISALHGSGVGLLFKDILEAYDSAIQTLSTPQLTRLLQDLSTQHTPPLVNGRRIKLRYAHAGGHNPPIVVIHGNQVAALPDSYKRYLIKGFTEQLGLVGTPLKLEFKGNVNPFKGKKNPLNARQVKHRQRLMKRAKRRPN